MKRPRKPGRKRDAYDRMNTPTPNDKRDDSLVKVFDGFPWSEIEEVRDKAKESQYGGSDTTT